MLTAREAFAFVRKNGIVLLSARGPVPSLVEAIAGEPIPGSWWVHPQARPIYKVVEAVTSSEDIVTCRLVGGKITLIHRRLWPALVRLSHRIPRRGLAAVRQEHTAQGRHRNVVIPFPRWVPDAVRREAEKLDETEAIAAMGADVLQVISPSRPSPAAKRSSPPRRSSRRAPGGARRRT